MFRAQWNSGRHRLNPLPPRAGLPKASVWLCLALTVVALLGVGSAHGEERDKAVSFDELLAQHTSRAPEKSAETIARALASEYAQREAGARAVAYLAHDLTLTDSQQAWFAAYAEQHLDADAGALALDVYLSRAAAPDALARAESVAQNHAGKKAGLAAAKYLIQGALDASDTGKLRQWILWTLKEYSPDAFAASNLARLMVVAFDALGEPAIAYELAGLSQQESIAYAMQDQAGLIRRLGAEEGPEDLFGKLLSQCTALFAADFKQEHDAFEDALVSLVAELEMLASQPETGARLETGDVPLLAATIVYGLARRKENAASFFNQRSTRAVPSFHVLLDPMLALVRAASAGAPDRFSRSTLSWAAALSDSGLLLGATAFYHQVLDMTESPRVTTEAATKLAKLYVKEWGALESAAEVLEGAMDNGALPSAGFTLAKIRYDQGDYDSALSILSDAVESAADGSSRERITFLIGMTLHRMHRRQEGDAVWRSIHEEVTDPKLKDALDYALGNPAEVP